MSALLEELVQQDQQEEQAVEALVHRGKEIQPRRHSQVTLLLEQVFQVALELVALVKIKHMVLVQELEITRFLTVVRVVTL